MMKIVSGTLLAVSFAATVFAPSGLYDFTMKSIDGKPVPLSDFRGKVVMLVNVASQCGYTPQYAGLQKLYERYKDRGFVIVGVPANNFGGQEPGSDVEIKQFCSRTYSVSFPMMGKVSVKGSDQAPLYAWLTNATANPAVGGEVKWNFTKFLVNRNGQVITRFESQVTPEAPEVSAAVEQALGK